MPSDPASVSARARFQSGLLAWLRRPDDAAGLREMIAVLRDMAVADARHGGVLWRSADAFLSSLLDGSLTADDGARHLCRRIERHLAAVTRGEPSADADLRQALFAFVSGHAGSPVAGAESSLPMTSLPQALGGSLARTAELLPLVAGARTPRHPTAEIERWLQAARALDAAWYRFACGRTHDCRPEATALVGTALELGSGAGMRLAEALASACASAEAGPLREYPALRAAIAAALEIATERDGPNHAHFEQRTEQVAARIDRVLRDAGPAY